MNQRTFSLIVLAIVVTSATPALSQDVCTGPNQRVASRVETAEEIIYTCECVPSYIEVKAGEMCVLAQEALDVNIQDFNSSMQRYRAAVEGMFASRDALYSLAVAARLNDIDTALGDSIGSAASDFVKIGGFVGLRTLAATATQAAVVGAVTEVAALLAIVEGIRLAVFLVRASSCSYDDADMRDACRNMQNFSSLAEETHVRVKDAASELLRVNRESAR